MEHDPNNADQEWNHYVGLAFHKINDERKLAGYNKYAMGRFLKRLKGLNTKKLRDLHFYCEAKERQDNPSPFILTISLTISSGLSTGRIPAPISRSGCSFTFLEISSL